VANRQKIMQGGSRGNGNYDNENIRNNEKGEAKNIQYFFLW
jgi:hypothetical protein